jgi:hypothetical protein
MSEEQLELLHTAIKCLQDYQNMSGTQSATFVLGMKLLEKIEEVDA